MLTQLANTLKRMRQHHIDERGVVAAAHFTASLANEIAVDLPESCQDDAGRFRRLARGIEGSLQQFNNHITEALDQLDKICQTNAE